MAECTDLSGEMKKCPVFELAEDASSCAIESLPDELKDELNEGPMSGLPGGCEIQSGPERAKKGKGASGSSSGGKSKGASSPMNKSKAKSPAAQQESSPVVDAPKSKSEGGVSAETEPKDDYKKEKHAEEKAPEPVAIAPAPEITDAPEAAPAAENAGNVVRTERYTSNGIVYENLVVMQEVTVTEGAAKAKRTPEADHVKRHGHRHEHVKRHAHGGRRLS